MTKISFVIPIYNNETYVAQCIESLCRQKEREIEILLVDDGSTDQSGEICRAYAEKDCRIRVFHQSNQGANTARNKGLAEAKGEWICFVDGDDYVEGNLCSVLLPYLRPEYDMIIYSYYRIFGKVQKRVRSARKEIELGKRDFEDMQIAAMNCLGPYRFNASCLDAVSVWNKIYRKEFLEQHHLCFIPELRKLQDLTFNLKVYDFAEHGLYLNAALYNYRINASSVSNRYQPDIVEKFQQIHRFLIPFVEEKQDSRLQEVLWERIATHMRTCTVLYFCNRKNRKPYAERKQDFFIFLEQEPFATARQKVHVTHFTFKEMLLSRAVNRKCFFVCELLNRLYDIWCRILRI
ncbi:MAG: glycosyltransferase [Clostridiales bacterium]|nr:glycosyltransferase [Clostridiales bacterium]